MKRVWPMIAVEDVPASAKWYMDLLDAEQTHPGGTHFDQIVDEDGTVLVCLHSWDEVDAQHKDAWPQRTFGESHQYGFLLWFVVDDFKAAWERTKQLGAVIDEEPSADNGTGKPAFVIRDPDGYHVAINESWGQGAA
jgi:uncharacterized glyoxalase superfamily protein PhnB